MLPERFTVLIDRYKNNQLNEEEMAELRLAVLGGLDDDLLRDDILQTLAKHGVHDRWSPKMENEAWENVAEVIRKPRGSGSIFNLRHMAAAAAIILVSITGAYFWMHPKPKKDNEITVRKTPDILPGGNKAFLTLANGAIIVLDSAQNGLLAQQDGSIIRKMDSGQIIYNAQNEKPAEILMNTLATPRGGQYRLGLPDGTAVWLNAASSIRYPVAFIGKERKVTVSGEVYFEVAKDATKPFKVVSSNQEITILGTHFNINGYADEADVKTTLLEGSIKLKTGDENIVLKPGQQARLAKTGRIKIIQDENAEQVIAWKNGFFMLTNTALPDLLNQVARWYDVMVVFENGVPAGHLTGRVLRTWNLSEFVKLLNYSGFKVRVEGRKLIVS